MKTKMIICLFSIAMVTFTLPVGAQDWLDECADRFLKEIPTQREILVRQELALDPSIERLLIERELRFRHPEFDRVMRSFYDTGVAPLNSFTNLLQKNEAGENKYLNAYCLYYAARSAYNNYKYADAEKLFELVGEKYTNYMSLTDELDLYLGLSYAKQLDSTDKKTFPKRDQAIICLKDLSERMQASERFREAAYSALCELDGGSFGPLPELGSKMTSLQERLSNGETGKSVQKKQAELIAELDGLIKKMQVKEDRGGMPNMTKKAGDVEMAQRSNLHREDMKRDWMSSLTDKERAAALQALDKMPLRYRELIFQYFKDLAKYKDPKKPDENRKQEK